MRSLSEIDTISKRASRAKGFSWGTSEEIGKSIRLLELFSLPGIKHLNSYYKDKKKKNFDNLSFLGDEMFYEFIENLNLQAQEEQLENLN